jgi:multidrug resistance efflux pump
LAIPAAVGVAAGTGLLRGLLPHPEGSANPDPPDPEDTVVRPPTAVKVVHPRRDPSVQLTVEDPAANVEAYYLADLRARASGLVKSVYKDIGDRVEQGELLAEIDAPDLVQDVAQKQAAVVQRQQELRVAKVQLKNAEAGREVARAAIKEKEALVTQAEATRDFRELRLARMRNLAKTDSVVAGVIAEEERDTKAAVAAVAAAQAAVERAKAAVVEADSTVEAAAADIDLKAALVEVARRDLEKARAVLGFSRVIAPFDGVVTRRNVDPGSFVQNATTGQTEPLISVARTDLVTVAARFPDTVAPFIAEDTEAEITVDNLAGVTIAGKVTRFAPSIQSHDRTVRVEVDLFNGDEQDYQRIVNRVLGGELSPLGATGRWMLLGARVAGRCVLDGLHKGGSDFLPAAGLPHSSDPARRLLPGMTGRMKLLLRHFAEGYVLPSTAVYTRGGKPYILTVEDGVTKQYPVKVQVNDGRVAKVALVTRRKDRSGVSHEVVTELTGRELVLDGRQLEVGEGVSVQATPAEW